MKTGDIVVYTGNTETEYWPKNVRDGVVTLVKGAYAFVRPYQTSSKVCMLIKNLRVILPNRLRATKPEVVSKPTVSVVPGNLDTYWGWKAKGRYVMKGQKSSFRDKTGTALFRYEQTSKNDVTVYVECDGCEDLEMDDHYRVFKFDSAYNRSIFGSDYSRGRSERERDYPLDQHEAKHGKYSGGPCGPIDYSEGDCYPDTRGHGKYSGGPGGPDCDGDHDLPPGISLGM